MSVTPKIGSKNSPSYNQRMRALLSLERKIEADELLFYDYKQTALDGRYAAAGPVSDTKEERPSGV